MRDWCNLGYARKACGRFPDDGGPDAVRFAISGDCNGVLRISYVLEKNHRPHEHGRLEFDRQRQTFLNPHPNPVLRRQARAYAESYLRRKYER